MYKHYRSILAGVLLFGIAAAFLLFQGCIKDDSPVPGSGGTPTGYGNAMIWTKNGNLGNVTVKCQGETKIISKYFSTGEPSGCGVDGFANFYLPVGSYTMTASNASGITWNGTITINDGQCTLQELTYSGSGSNGGTNGGGGNNGSGYGNAMVWTQNSTLGTITVVCEGQSQTITQYSTSGSPTGCGVSGFANFTLAQGTHSYTASSVSGVTWSGSLNVTADGCYLKELSYSGNGGGGTTTGDLIVWEKNDDGGGATKITVNGQTGYISSTYPNASQYNPPPCGASGCATFYSLAPGTHTIYYSNAVSSGSYQVIVNAGGCNSFMFY